MTTPPSSSEKRRPAVAKRIGRKLDARVKPDTASSAEPGLVDQVRAMAGRLLDISAATGVAGRALQTAGKVSRALQDGHPIDAASEVVRAVLPGSRPVQRFARCARQPD